MLARTTKRKRATAECTADDGAGEKTPRQRRVKGRGTRQGNHQSTEMGTGTSEPSDMTDPSMAKCLHCSALLKPALDSTGCSVPLLQCPQCPAPQPLCEQCLYPCSNTSRKGVATCTNKSCQLVSLLLKCDQVTEASSRVKGCPQFRSCPKCHNLMMHGGGCKYVRCSQCSHGYCFICLCSTEECAKDTSKYWSLTCSRPRAARQRFQT